MNQYDMLETAFRTVDQMVQLFDCAEAVAHWSDAKIARLAQRCAETEGKENV